MDLFILFKHNNCTFPSTECLYNKGTVYFTKPVYGIHEAGLNTKSSIVHPPIIRLVHYLKLSTIEQPHQRLRGGWLQVV